MTALREIHRNLEKHCQPAAVRKSDDLLEEGRYALALQAGRHEVLLLIEEAIKAAEKKARGL